MSDDAQAPGGDGSGRPKPEEGRAGEDSRLQILSRLALDLFSIPTEEALFRHVVREAVGRLGLANCSIFLFNPSRGLYELVAACGPDADQEEFRSSDEVVRRTIDSGEAVFCGCGHCAECGLCVPLHLDGRPVGTLCCVNSRGGRFSPEDQKVLKTVAAMTGARLGLLRKDAALRASEAEYRSLFETASAGIGRSVLKTGQILRANLKLAEIFGYASAEQMIAGFSTGGHFLDLADRERLLEGARLAPGVPVEIAYRRTDGSVITTLVYAEPDAALCVLNFAVVDITEVRELESELQKHRALIQALFRHAPVALSIKDLEGRIVYVSPMFTRFIGVSAEEAAGRMSAEFLSPETLRVIEEADDKVKRTGRALELDEAFEIEVGPATLLVTKFPIRDQAGAVSAIGTAGIDITERKLAENRLRQSERQLREAARIAKLGSWEVDGDGRLYWSEETFRMFGVSPEEFDGTTRIFYDRVHPDDREMVRQKASEVRRTGAPYDCVHRILRPDGALLTVREGAEVVYDAAGELVGLFGAVQDITEAVATEARLLQAQKMEAVGQLTGGVAHDFNNLLMIIQGNAELLAEQPGVDRSLLEAIIRAVGRGAELTSRLLAFSRLQALHPRPVNLGEMLAGMKTLLERSLGETVEIDIIPPASPGIARADPGQVENAILNLALNARDAMPRGGRLCIECADVHLDATAAQHPDLAPGDYVMLAVHDEGVGMSPEVQRHAFDPFFTTKEVGEGSGLGLSMVYGFAKQSGGHVSICSEPGKGTTVMLYLPAASQSDLALAPVGREEVPRGHGERILVVEDNAAVRALTVQILEDLGYRVTAVSEAAEAEALLAAGEAVDLVLSDVVLPGAMSGPEFAEKARAADPGLAIIFMSGYPSKAARREGFLSPGDVLLNKPFERRVLAQAVRDALQKDQGSPARKGPGAT